MIQIKYFTASLGGLLGLFVGFSFMSAFELIYFFLIRVMFDVWTKHRENNSRQNNQPEDIFKNLTDKKNSIRNSVLSIT